ncbi:GNAT family N-acetyltransferase [Kitasatospora sp. NPDC058046]|uniref:GNAT family N-acetyltransferase n=1 Tax=Kitasatospora sp. NPDC058046 TaxID=3346312 RepID=UPI0036D885FF
MDTVDFGDFGDFGDFVVRRGTDADADGLTGIDSVALEGDGERAASIRRWCRQAPGPVLVAEDASGLLGYCVTEYTFFEQGFVTMLMVSPAARGRGVGRRLLDAAAASCETPKLFTSTNVSNQPMRRLLHRAGWQPVGLVQGLDEGDPELFHLYRPQASRPGPPSRTAAEAESEATARLDSAWEWWSAAIEDAQEGHWIRTSVERRVMDDLAAATVGLGYLDPSVELPLRNRLCRIATWAGAVRLAARAGGWELAPVTGAAPPRPAGMAELLSAVHAVGEQGEIWRRLPADGPPPPRALAGCEAFLFGPGSVEDLRQFFYD